MNKQTDTPRTCKFKEKWTSSRRHNWPCSFESEAFYEMMQLERELAEAKEILDLSNEQTKRAWAELDDVRNDGAKHISLYHQKCMELETALFGKESDALPQENERLKRELAAATKQRDALADALQECKEDSEELIEERKWWENEPRGNYAAEYAELKQRVENANKAIAVIKWNA